MVGFEVLCSSLMKVIVGLVSYYQRRMSFWVTFFTRLWPYNRFPQFQSFSSLGCQAQFHLCLYFWPVVDLTFAVGGDLNDSQMLSLLRYWSCFCEESSSCQAFDPSGEVTFSLYFYCHESPNVLPSTFTLPGESRQCLLPDVT